MIYTKNSEYYLKRPEKLVKLNVSLNKNGDVDLTPTRERIEILNDKALAGYYPVTLDDIKKNLTKKVEKSIEKLVENPLEKPKEEVVRFPGLFESKKVNKNK